MQETEYRAYLNNIALTKDSPYFSPDIYTPEPDPILLRGPRSCKKCGRLFISAWGIPTCSAHKDLEELPKPKKPKEPKRSVKKIARIRKEIVREYGAYCAICGSNEGLLQLHHVIPSLERPGLLYEKSNLALLCTPCHSQHHRGIKPIDDSCLQNNCTFLEFTRNDF